jgi:hypothetical protein
MTISYYQMKEMCETVITTAFKRSLKELSERPQTAK